MTIALIDGDVISYMSAFASQRNIYYVDIFYNGDATEQQEFISKDEAENFVEYTKTKPEYQHHNFVITKEVIAESPKHAELCAKQIMTKILADTKATNYKIFLTSPDKSNFRYKIAKTKPYKGNRKAEKPVHYELVRSYLHYIWGAYVVVGEEADDYISIEQCNNLVRDANGKLIDSKTIASSIDKDIENQVPGHHHNIRTGELKFVTEDESMRFFWKQMLMGDTIDNIQGVPKFGKIKANRLIDKCETLEECREKVQDEYQKYYKDDWNDKYLEMGNLLWIKREPNVIFEDLKL